MSVKLYVEGGGDRNKALQTECRAGFAEFLSRAGLKDRMPRIVACGGRRQAYDRFQSAVGGHDTPVLLVDSEGPVTANRRWDHVRSRDGWVCPPQAAEDHLHLMVQAMEAWFYADKEALATFYGNGFRPNSLSGRNDVENIPKDELENGLKNATSQCQKGEYSKGDHSFQILKLVCPAKVRKGSPHGDRFLSALDALCR